MQLLAVLGSGVVDPTAAVVLGDDLGLTRGDGCFEGCRIRAGAVDKLDAHLARMRRSATSLEIGFDEDGWRTLIERAVTAWTAAEGAGEAAMKLMLTRGRADAPTGLLTITRIPPDYARQRRDGISVCALDRGTAFDAYADAPWLLGGVKTLSYAVNMAAQREAVRRGSDDAIFLSTDGGVLESSTGSVVWAAGQRLASTPSGRTGILRGTTQELLFQRAAAAGWQPVYERAEVADLLAADAVWVVSSVRGAVQIVELDGKPLAAAPVLTREIQRLAGF